MKKPKRPTRPRKPVEPEEYNIYYNDTCISEHEDEETLDVVLGRLKVDPNNFNPKLLKVRLEEDWGHYDVIFSYPYTTKRDPLEYQKELAEYQVKLKLYEDALAKYDIDFAEYKEKLTEYQDYVDEQEKEAKRKLYEALKKELNINDD